MRMGEGVEWGLHCCLALAWIGGEEPLSTAKLAAWFELPPAYLNKRLQALVRAGVLTSTAGARGGFRLARPPEKITLMDVVSAIEGPEEAFRCAEIRQRGAGAEAPVSRLPARVWRLRRDAPSGAGVAAGAGLPDSRRPDGERASVGRPPAPGAGTSASTADRTPGASGPP